MRADSTLTASQREELVALFEQGFSYGAAANRVGVRHGPAKNLYQRFKLRGRLCLVRKRRKQEYSFEVKKEVVERYLAGEAQLDIAREFGLWSDQQVKDWVVKWRKGGDESLKPRPIGRPRKSGKPKVLTEEETLRRENELLRAENAYLKKLRDLRDQGHA